MDDTEVCFILQFFRLEELWVSALLLEHLLHKALVCCFREPTLLIQQSQDTRGTGLHTGGRAQVSVHEKLRLRSKKKCKKKGHNVRN